MSVVPEREVYARYELNIRELRAIGLLHKLQNDEIDKILHLSISSKTRPRSMTAHRNLSIQESRKMRTVKLPLFASIISLSLALTVFISSLVTYGVLTYHNQSYYVVARNVQDLIHPMMRMLRHITLPIIRTFPGVTALYDESCLLVNPFSSYRKTDCWPCTGVYSPIIIAKPVGNPQSWQPYSVYPFLMKGVSPEVTFSDIKAMYWQNQEVLDQYAYKIVSTVSNWTTISDVMSCDLEENPTPDKTSHITWRINQLDATQPVRKLFKRPAFIPQWVNVERYIFIDEQNSTGYDVPITESFNVFLMQASGERRVVLEPIHSCQSKCPRMSVHLKPSYLIYFSNLYYSLKSYPVKSGAFVSVTYMGAY